MRPPLEFSLGFVAIEVSLRRCTELLPEVSPVFVRAGAIVGEISPTCASLSEASLYMYFFLEFSIGFVAIDVSVWRQLLVVFCATRLTRMPTGYVAGVVQGR